MRARTPAGIVFSLILIAGIFLGILHQIKQSGSYQASLAYLGHNPTVIDEVGDVQGYGFMPNGSTRMTGDGVGVAHWIIQVKGTRAVRYFLVKLHKNTNEPWEIDLARDSDGKPLPL